MSLATLYTHSVVGSALVAHSVLIPHTPDNKLPYYLAEKYVCVPYLSFFVCEQEYNSFVTSFSVINLRHASTTSLLLDSHGKIRALIGTNQAYFAEI